MRARCLWTRVRVLKRLEGEEDKQCRCARGEGALVGEGAGAPCAWWKRQLERQDGDERVRPWCSESTPPFLLPDLHPAMREGSGVRGAQASSIKGPGGSYTAATGPKAAPGLHRPTPGTAPPPLGWGQRCPSEEPQPRGFGIRAELTDLDPRRLQKAAEASVQHWARYYLQHV